MLFSLRTDGKVYHVHAIFRPWYRYAAILDVLDIYLFSLDKWQYCDEYITVIVVLWEKIGKNYD